MACFHLTGGHLRRANANTRCRAAAFCKIRQRFNGRCRCSKMVDEITKRCRTDIVGADQAEPVEFLVVCKRNPPASRFFQMSAFNCLFLGLLADSAFGTLEEARDILAVVEP